MRKHFRSPAIRSLIAGAVALIAAVLSVTGVAVAARIDVSGPIAGAPLLGLGRFDLKSLGYVTEEYFLTGTATSYKRVGQPGEDGRWTAAPATTSPYVTRIVVVRPSDPAKFNGTIVVEWLNVTGGVDAPADWITAHREMIRGGYAFVGVSAQRVGIEGGPSLMGGMPLKKADPARYGQLNHPGDAFAYDIYSQAGRAVRGEGSEGVLGPLRPRRVLSIGESQSAVFLTTYVNAIDPIAKVFDGFLIHSRFGGGSTIEGAAFQAESASDLALAVKLREDLRVPVITIITETDLIGGQLNGFIHAQQPDNTRLRIWEIPGTAHADTYILGAASIDSGSAPIEALAAALKPTKNLFGTPLAFLVNAAPQAHYVVEAALWRLDRWVRTGQAPPRAQRLKATLGDKPGDPARLTLDANGIAEGGIRTPWVDVPTARTSGVGNSGGALGFLFGVTEPFDQARLDSLYPRGKAEYLTKFDASLRATIASGFILPADKAEIEALAAAMYPGSK